MHHSLAGVSRPGISFPRRQQGDSSLMPEQSSYRIVSSANMAQLEDTRIRITKLSPVTYIRGGHSAELCTCSTSRDFPHVRSQDREQRDKTTPCHNAQLESRFRFLALLSPFHFGSIEFETRETLTYHVHVRRHSAVFSATSLSTRVVERTNRHNNGTILSKKKPADRQHELPSV